MVLGLSRTRLRPEGTPLLPLRSAVSPATVSRDWIEQRGTILFEAPADILGGFPGYADRGAALEHASVRVTEGFLLIDEGESHGFGLPIGWIEGIVLVAQPGREDYALRVFYRDGALPRLFTIRFRSQRLSGRSTRRSLRAHEALLAGGLRDGFGEQHPIEPSFTLPWDQTREYEQENVIWTGRATAPVRVGAEHAPSDIWLTTKSLIWGSGEGDGINRVPLPLLMDLVTTRLRDRLGTPAIYLAIGDERTGRFELPFLFDQQTPPDRNFRERGAFLVGLRSRGVPDGVATPTWQPWRLDLFPGGDAAPESTAEMPDSGIAAPADEPAPAAYAIWPEAVDTAQDSPLRRRRGRLGERVHRTPAVAQEPGAETETSVAGAAADDRPMTALVLPEPPKASDDTDEIPLILQHPHHETAIEPAVDMPIETAEDRVLAEWAPLEAEGHALPAADVAIAQEWATSAPVATPVVVDQEPQPAAAVAVEPEEVPVDRVEAEQLAPTQPEPAPEPVDIVVTRPSPAIDPWAAVRRYEADAVGALAEVLRAIDDRVAGREARPLSEVPPSSLDQARAITELAELQVSGATDAATARGRRERLLILGDVCVRLRTVVELHDAGYLSATELEAKRAALTRSLSDVLIPGGR